MAHLWGVGGMIVFGDVMIVNYYKFGIIADKEK
jgi:hypothetical protein